VEIEEKAQPEQKDSRVKGIIFVNFFAFFLALLGACMKEVAAQGISIGEF